MPSNNHQRYVDISAPDFPAQLKRFRHAAGFTRQQLSVESGVSERTIIKFETGHGQRAKDSTLLALCTALKITQDQLIPPPVKPAPPTVPAPPGAEKRSRSVVPSRFNWRRTAIGVTILLVLIVAWTVVAGPFSFLKNSIVDSTTSVKNRILDTISLQATDDFPKIQASRLYTEGCENLKRLYRDEARACFTAALKHDSTFAKAYVMQLHPHIQGTREKSLELIANARAHQHHLTPAEKLFLDAMESLVNGNTPSAIGQLERLVDSGPHMTEAYRILAQLYQNQRNYPKSIGCLNAAVMADSLDGMSFNRLAYVYMELGRFDDALAAVDAYMKLTPSEPNPHDTRGDILSRMGLAEEAIASYHQALEHKRDFFPSLQSLGRMYLLKGDYPQAEKYYRKLSQVDDPGAQSRSSLYLSCMLVFQGKLDEALAQLELTAQEDVKDQRFQGCLGKKSLKSLILLEKGEAETALNDFRQALEDRKHTCKPSGLGRPITAIQLLTAVDIELARAYLDSLTLKAKDGTAEQLDKLWFCKGWLEMCEERPEEAIGSFSRAAEIDEPFYVRYQLALAYLKSKRTEKAVEEFERVLTITTDDRVKYALWSVKAHYYLGQAYLENGQLEKAGRQFDIFLSMWKDADWVCEEIASAKKYVTSLSSEQSVSTAQFKSK